MKTYIAPIDTDVLLLEAQMQELYLQLILQLNKDFVLANERLDFATTLLPEQLKQQLFEKVYHLLCYKFAEYLNLLYIIDVSEKEIKILDGSNLHILAQQVSFLILKREWQKVWFKNNY